MGFRKTSKCCCSIPSAARVLVLLVPEGFLNPIDNNKTVSNWFRHSQLVHCLVTRMQMHFLTSTTITSTCRDLSCNSYGSRLLTIPALRHFLHVDLNV